MKGSSTTLVGCRMADASPTPARCGWLVAASAAAAALLGGLAAPAQAQLTDGLQLYFDFETSSITNVVAGDSGYTPSVTLQATPQSGFTGSASRPLLVGNALDLVRSENGWVNISNIGSGSLASGGLDLAGSFTMSTWAYLDVAQGIGTGSNRYFVWEGSTDYDVSFGSLGDTTGPDSYLGYTTTSQAVGVQLQRNIWNNIVQVFSNDGTDISSDLYVNGQLIGSRTAALADMNWVGLRFGNNRDSGDRAWEGTLDEIGIWNAPLAAADIQEVYIRGLQGTTLTAATSDVGTWSTTAAGAEWTAGSDWTGGTVVGTTGGSAGSSNAVAIFGEYSLPTGLGIDMSTGTAAGALGLGAIVLDSTSGTLRIGNSSATDNGVLQLNGATTAAGANTLLSVAGTSDLVIADSPDPLNPGSTTLGVTLGIANGTISIDTDRTATIASVIGETAAGSGFTKTGPGTLVLSGGNTYTGTTTISAGTVRLAASNSLADSSDLAIAGGTFDLGSFSDTLDAVTVTAPASITGTGNLTATTIDVSNSSGTVTVSAGLAGATAVTKTGAGTLLLSGTNAQTGATAVNEGTLVASSAATLGAGTVTISGGELNYIGSESLTNAVVLSGDASGNTISITPEIEYLIIGGGGGGAGRDIAGGGGAGGYRSSVVGELSGGNTAAEPTLLLAPGDYPVVVGGGGSGGIDTGSANGNNGADGDDSSAFGIIAAGGGGGAGWGSTPAAGTGGSGGGGSGGGATAGGSGLAGQGFNGGTGVSSGTSYGGAGGGGAGRAGANATAGRAGGDGIASNITGTSVFRAGGGGGGGHRSSGNGSLGAGGLGGGGSATVNGGAASDGDPNTGGGGGASRSEDGFGGAGGSGVVIVRYAGSPIATGGSIDSSSVAGHTVHSFTNVGTETFSLGGISRTIAGDISGTGGFTFNSPGATLILSGTNTYSGGTIVSAGTLNIGSATALGTGPLAVNAAGTVALAAEGVSSYSLPAVSGAGTLSAAGKSLSIGSDNSSSAFAGSITADSLTKQGTGGLGLSGTNTLTSTTISSGSVTAISSDAFGTGGVTLSGGNLRLGNNVSLANAITLSAEAASTTLGGPLMDYLIVGGGGGGAGRDGGGGGGGVLSNLIGRGDPLPAVGSYDITVGSGGDGGVNGFNSGTSGQNGGNSILGSLTADGGGGGSFYAGTAGQGGSPGGSGGGGGRGEVNPNPGAGTAGQGFAGGAGTGGSAANNAAGGGGGAGGVGQDGTLGVKGGDGGSGVAVAITGTDAFYGGGGGGSVYRVPSPADMAGGAGGIGGGGAASMSRGGAPTTGTANTGGGGGASRNDTTNSNGAAGGSGIVVVRYLGEAAATGGEISSGTGSAEGYTIHTFKSGTDTLAFNALAATISGNIGGTGGFTWDTPGGLTLSGTNTYSGGTIVSAGTLTAGSAAAFGSGTITLASGTTIDLGNYAISNTITNNGGTILNAGSYDGTQSVDGDATFAGDVGGTVQIGNGGVGRFEGEVGGRVEIAAGGIAELDDSASVGAAAEFVTNGVLRANRGVNMTIGRPISGSGSFQKQGAGRLVLSGTSTYTGGTDVDAGALVVDGSILGDVALAAGSRLGGSGSIGGTVSGGGVFGPGNSPGITTVGSIDPSGGLSFELEITGSLADWDAPTASINDVIRLTDATPFTTALSAGNTISILLDIAGADPAAPGTYTGGFFTDTAADFASAIASASFEYWVAGELGTLGDRQQFATGSGGALEWYTLLSAYDPALSVQWTTAATTADFGAGPVSGYATQFVVVPEPGMLVLAGLGLSGLLALLRHRRQPS